MTPLLLLLLASFPASWSGVLVPTTSAVATPHYTDLTWQDLVNPAGTTSYNVYKAMATCADTAATYQLLVSGIQAGPTGLAYRDNAVVAGQTVCYYVTAFNGQESVPSNKAEATTPTAQKAAPAKQTFPRRGKVSKKK